MNLISINLYANAYYSGNTYDETIFLLEDDYKKIGTDLNGNRVSVGELDGKHSDVSGEITVEVISEDEQENFKFEVENDGNCLLYEIDEYLNESEQYFGTLDEMIKRANNYIENLDSLVEVKYTVKKSQVSRIEKFILENIKNK